MIPSSNADTVVEELDHVGKWAETCNLKLNHNKTHEMLIRRGGGRVGQWMAPSVIPGVSRVDKLTVLGVTLTETLNFEAHISQICCKARQSMYALHILTAHGLKGVNLFDVARATTVARLLYASPAWWGFARQQDKNRLQSIISRMIRRGYLPIDNPTFDQLCHKADTGLFTAVLNNPGHVLHKLLPPRKSNTYALRPRSHDRVLTLIDNNMRKTFVGRMLYSY